MASIPQRPAAYLRISRDDLDEGNGVARQREDVLALAERLGWPEPAIYEDNDTSAFDRKRKREGWTRLLADLQSGAVDGLLIYHPDRLVRQMRELEDLLDIVEPLKVPTHSVSGQLDLSTDAGVLLARILTSVSNNESRSIGRRVKRAHEQLAQQGKPSGGPRPFGFKPGGIEHDTAEAEVIRELIDKVIAGETATSLARWLNERGVEPPRAERWSSPSVKALLASPRIAGLRALKGEIICKAVWEPIVSEEDWRAASGILNDPARKKPGNNTRRHLLSGFLVCGACGRRLRAHVRPSKAQYCCRGGATMGGCGKVARDLPMLESLISKYVLGRLSQVDPQHEAEVLAANESDRQALARVEAEIAELDELREAEELALRDYVRLLSPLREREGQLTKQVQRRVVVPVHDDPAGDWEAASLEARRALLAQVVDHVIVSPANYRGRNGQLDITTIDIVPTT